MQPATKKPSGASFIILVVILSVVFIIAGVLTSFVLCDSLSCVGTNLNWMFIALPIIIIVISVIYAKTKKK